jgi:hypothetical protein
MDWYWTWGGECFGYRLHDWLFAYHGLQVGQFHGDEVYGTDGGYLGQVKREKRLITDLGKNHLTKLSFDPVMDAPYEQYPNRVVFGAYAGFKDFPTPEDFRRVSLS